MRRPHFLDAFRPPESPLERERQARVIRPVYWIGLVLTAVVLPLQLLSTPGALPQPAIPSILTLATMLACLPLMRRGREHSVALIILAASACINAFSLYHEGILSPSSRTYDALVVAAGLVVGHRLVLPVAAMGVLGMLLGLASQALGTAPGTLTLHDAVVHTVTAMGLLCALATIVYFAARSIRDRAAFNESIVAALPGVIYIFNFKLGRSRWLNRSLVAGLGWSPEGDWESIFLRVMHPDDRANVGALLERWRTVEDGQVLLSEFRLKDSEGRWHTFESRDTVYARGQDGQVAEFIGYIEEITDKRRALEALGRSERLQSLSQLAGGVAHDFNNVLAPILGHAELIRSGLPDTDPRAEAARAVQRLVDRARGLTQRMLDLDHNRPVRLQELDLDQVVRGFLPLLQRTLRHDLSLDYAGPGRPALVMADAPMVERMLLNLAINAQDVVPAGDRLTVRLEVLPDAAVLHFSDRGPGMEPEVRARAFEPFFTTKEPGLGTGLGLSMVHAAMLQHGGGVELDTEPGKGCHFRLRFPLSAGAAPSGDAAAGGPGRVLLVDDEEDLRLVLRRMLEQLGWTVLEAATAASAVAVAAQAGRLDLLLTDIRLPGMRGPELAAELRRRQPDLPIAYMTGFSDTQVDGPVLAKPFDMADLKDLLARVSASRAG